MTEPHANGGEPTAWVFPAPMLERIRSVLTPFRDEFAFDRAMVRLIEPDSGYAPAVVQLVRDGVDPVLDDRSIDFSTAPTFMAVRDRGAVLIQPDVAAAPPPATPPHLVKIYGIRAQMLHPVYRGGAAAGLLAVHEVANTRQWSPAEVTRLREVADAVSEIVSDYDTTEGESHAGY